MGGEVARAEHADDGAAADSRHERLHLRQRGGAVGRWDVHRQPERRKAALLGGGQLLRWVAEVVDAGEEGPRAGRAGQRGQVKAEVTGGVRGPEQRQQRSEQGARHAPQPQRLTPPAVGVPAAAGG